LPSFAKEKIHKLIIFPTLWIMIPQMGILREYTTKFMKYPTVAWIPTIGNRCLNEHMHSLACLVHNHNPKAFTHTHILPHNAISSDAIWAQSFQYQLHSPHNISLFPLQVHCGSATRSLLLYFVFQGNSLLTVPYIAHKTQNYSHHLLGQTKYHLVQNRLDDKVRTCWCPIAS
jgi:hypothetical protein